MRIKIILLAVVPALSSCGQKGPIDCGKVMADMAEFNQCWSKNQTRGDASALVACLPFSDIIKTEGYWVVGFEKNDFLEGNWLPPEDVRWSLSTGARLVVDPRLLKPRGHTPRIFEVSLVGRRALCPVGVINPYPIVVEKLQIKRRVG